MGLLDRYLGDAGSAAGGEPVVDAGGEVTRDDGADDGDRDQPGDARDGVVDAGCDAGVLRPAAPSTAAVSGATVIAARAPNSDDAGQHVRRRSAGGRRRSAAAAGRRRRRSGRSP